ncbi:kinesin-like protein KIF21A [Mizuhopecten yessoensis]|nr:kinesin-like protein KIF21A [Mizuhopecten yessoensis]
MAFWYRLTRTDQLGSTDHHVIAGVQGIANVLSVLGGNKKGAAVPYRDSIVTRLLQESLGGNAVTMMFAVVAPTDRTHQETFTTLQYASYAKSVKNHVKMNMNPYDDSSDIIQDLRDEISKLRDRIASASEPKKEDVLKMEDLVKDLQIAKQSTWAERERLSNKFEEERKINLANKGILEWVTDNVRKGNKELQEKMVLLQKEKDQLTLQYKERRKGVDVMNEELQKKIAEYSKWTETGKSSESETKKRVTAIHELKERLKKETDILKKLKQQIKDVQDKQREERENAKAQMTAIKGSAEVRQKVELEERHQLEQQNKAMVADELDKMNIEIEQEKLEIQVKMTEGKKYTPQEGAALEIQVVELKANKAVVAYQLQTLQHEKNRLAKELEDVYKLHKDEMEIQQLQHFQTFRSYREMFEEQKAALDQRYRQLLEDSIQDAVFLSSRNNELTEENGELKQSVAEMKDVITKLGGRIPSGTV